MKEFLKWVNISQSYKQISSGTFLWLTVYILLAPFALSKFARWRHSSVLIRGFLARLALSSRDLSSPLSSSIYTDQTINGAILIFCTFLQYLYDIVVLMHKIFYSSISKPRAVPHSKPLRR